MTRRILKELERMTAIGMENPNAGRWFATCLACKTKFRPLVAHPGVKCPFCDLRADKGMGIQFDSCDHSVCDHDHPERS